MSNEPAKIFVYGASGHAKVVIDIIEKQGLYEVAFLIDDNVHLHNTKLFGYMVIGGRQELLASGITHGIVAIGNNKVRHGVAAWLTENDFELVGCIMHPSVQLGRGVIIGNNTVVTAGAVINSDSSIGNNVIINTRASIDHDCVIGDGVHIAPGATLCGSVSIGTDTFVCAGATIIPNLTIGSNVIVGAGAVVIGNQPDNVTVVGCPARIVK